MQSTPANNNPSPEEAVLQCYDQIAAASRQMLEAARSADWDSLIAAEMACAHLINQVSALSRAATISDEGNRRRMAVIHRVLADDAEIRTLVEPRLIKLEGFLHGRENGRRLQNAYTH